MSNSKRDLVDWIGVAGGVLLRHPFLCLAVLSEVVLVLAGLGWLPRPVAVVVGIPAYGVHALSSFVFGSSYLPAAAGLIGIAGVLDMAWRGLLRGASPEGA